MAVGRSIKAVYFDGKTSEKKLARVEFGPKDIRIWVADSLEANWQRSNLFINFIGNDEVTIKEEIQSSAKLCIEGVENIGHVKQYAGNKGLSFSNNVIKQIAVFSIILIALIAGIWAFAHPASMWLAKKIPHKWEVEFRDDFVDNLKKYKCKETEAVAILQALAEKLLTKDPARIPIKVILIDWKMVNAFAYPGGIVVFTKGLLKEAKDPDEIAGVMAHELQHQIKRHILASLIRSTILTATWHVALGDYSGILVVDPSTIYQVASLKFNREMETEADSGAAYMLKAAKISQSGMFAFLKRLSDKHKLIPDFLSSHPMQGRAKFFEKLIEDKANLQPALSKSEFAILQSACPLLPKSSED